MKTYLDCLPCLLNQALRAARAATDDEAVQRQVVDAVARMIPELPLGLKPPEMTQRGYRLLGEITGNDDPFHQLKAEANCAVLAIYPRLQQLVQQSTDRLFTACKLAYTKGNEQDFIRWGEFRFKIAGRELSLQAYKRGREEETLFVPFKDATCGKETYGVGRYLDLEPGRDRTQEGKWILDFNQAYSPWCAYSEAYTCPFAPLENWLEVPVYAGEKDYHLPESG